MPVVGRVRNRVVAMIPSGAKDRLRRMRGRGPGPSPRAALTISHENGLIVYRGELRDPVRAAALIVRPASRLGEVCLRIDQTPGQRFEFTLDPSRLWQAGGGVAGRFDLFLEVEGAGAGLTELRLGRFDHTDTSAAMQQIEVDGAVSLFGEDAPAWTHVTDQGNVSVRFDLHPIRRHEVEGRKLVVNGHGISGELVLRTFSRPANSITFRLGRRFEDTVEDIPVRIIEHDPTATYGLHEYHLAFDVQPTAAGEEREGIIDPYLSVDLDGFDSPARVLLFHKDFPRARFADLSVPVSDGQHVDQWVPYQTFRGKRLAFWTERFTVANHAYLQRLMRWAWLLAPIRPFTGIWLVGEAPYKAQDNGFQLFRWIRQNHPEQRAYYVIDADSPDRAKVEELGNVVTTRSRDHIRYTVMASRFVGSHHAEYLHASRSERLARHAQGLRIFLQHGVTGMKNVRLNYGRLHMQEMPPDRVVVNSAAERQIFIEDFDYFPSQVKITGFARFDALFEGQPQVRRRVLVMPTWRDWLASREAILASKYLENWQEFLADPQIQQLRDDHDVEVLLVLHPNLRLLIDELPLEGITIAPRDADVQELIRTSAAVVTDYSSVAWDASFLGRPVFFFRFDDAVLTGSRVPFIDAATELPGPMAHRADVLAAEVLRSAEAGFVRSDEHAARAHKYLELPETGYCERNYEMVREADGLATRALRLRNRRGVRDAFKKFRAGPHYYRVMTWLFRFGSLLPRRDVAVFESDRGSAYGGSPRALFERLHERGTSLDLWYVNNSTLRVPPGTNKVFRLTPRYFWTLSRARYWVFNQNVHDLCQRPRGTHYLQTWHGTPLKRMQNDVPVMYGRADDYHQKAQELVDRWSALVSPSEFATGAFRSAFGFDGPILTTGYPGNDIFHTEQGQRRARETRNRLGIAQDRTVVLYAPTFRDDGRAPGASGAWSHEMALDLGRFAEKLGSEVTLLVRLHPLVKFKWPRNLDASIVNVSKYPDTQDLLLVADALITDYSSIMFDYAQRNRPIISFVYDLEHYRDDLRGFYVDLEEIAPGPMVRSSDEVIDAVSRIGELERQYSGRLAAFRERFGSLEDGHASDRVIDATFTETERGDAAVG